MNVLLVTPVEQGSGEIITCLHLAENLTANGHRVLFLASAFAESFLSPLFSANLRPLTQNGRANRETWDTTVREFHPDVIVFADYPLMHVAKGVTPLIAEPGWVESLDALDACLVTLDHFGFAQEEMGLFLGPPHLGFFYQKFPAIPRRMRILLPCPMHEPGPVDGRRGEPFRYWDVPLQQSEHVRREVRSRYLQDNNDFLVFHSVPNWAWRQADAMGLTLYSCLGDILDEYLRDLPKPVTVVSVNNGSLLQAPRKNIIRIVNLEPLPPSEFEALLLAADLVLTENSVSIAMGKAICGFQPCAALVNSLRLPDIVERLDDHLRGLVLTMESERIGAIFPFRVYPISMVEELDILVLYRDNSLVGAFRAIELFGGTQTKAAIRALLTDPLERATLHASQAAYLRRLAALGDGTMVLERLVEDTRVSQARF